MREVGAPLGLEAGAAAEAILRVVNARVAAVIRLVSVERGHGPSRFMAVCLGGGALHLGALLRDACLHRAVMPRSPSITSALGCVMSDVRQDRVATLNLALEALEVPALDRRIVEEAHAAEAVLQAAWRPVERVDLEFESDVHCAGQTHTVGVDESTDVDRAAVRNAFEIACRRAVSRAL